MGRMLKRVPLDFDWPLNHRWKGYLCPYRSQKCVCDGTGYNPATKQIADDFYDFAGTGRRWVDRITQDEVDFLVSKDRLVDFTSTWNGTGWVKDGRHPTAEQVNALNRSGGPAGFLAGHDGINRMYLIEARAKRLGVYGLCEMCKGEGSYYATPEIAALAEAWESTEPPKGEGFQLWENTSEGSPISPVFATLDDLCAWAADNATTCGSERTSAADWRRMLDENFVRHEEKVPGGPTLVFM